jgi:hypothetical protein
MKRLLLFVLLPAVALLALELSVRGGGRTTLLAPEDAFAPDCRGWCGAAWLETDAGGQRRGATEWLAKRRGRVIVAVGGAFTAGAGLEDDELYSARLEPHARAGGFERVVGLAVREDKVGAIRRTAATLGRDDVLVIELDARDLDGDPRPFVRREPARHVDAVAPSASAGLTFLRLAAARRERGRLEAEIDALVERDGCTGRATARETLRLAALTDAAHANKLDDEQAALLRGWLEQLHGLSRDEQRKVHLAEWTKLFEELQRDQRIVFAVVIGPKATTLALVQEARDAAFVVVHAPPFELDADLRMDVPWPRPAAAVHAAVADSLWDALTKRGLLSGAAAAPAKVADAAATIEQHVMSRGGFDEATIALARERVKTTLELDGRELPVSVLHGLAVDGRLEPGARAEILLRRPSFPTELIVTGDVPAGDAPRLSLRHPIGSATAEPEPVKDGRGSSHGREFQWRFVPPAQRSPIELTPLEFALLAPADGAAPAAIRLQSLRFVAGERPDDDH